MHAPSAEGEGTLPQPDPGDVSGFRILIRGPNYEGFVVVDSVVGGRSAGGVRITDDLRVEEVSALAREMTYKYALFYLPRGGAKAGVRLSSHMGKNSREQALRDFGKKLSPIIRNGIYSPGMDMNCGPDQLRAIYQGAGIQLGAPTDTSLYTALTVHHSLCAMAKHLGAAQRPMTLAVEGFGSVAQHLARRLDPSEFRIVALATIQGGVLSSQGFSLAELVQEKDRSGDAFVHDLSGESLTPAEILECEVDIVLPSSRTWVISPDMAERMRARAVVPISNAPYQEGTADILHRRGVMLLPGFVSNVGGVLASSLHDLGLPDETIESLVAQWYRPIVDAILNLAVRKGRPATLIAEELAIDHGGIRPAIRHRSITRRLHDRLIRPRLPHSWKARRARREFVSRSRRILDELRQRE